MSEATQTRDVIVRTGMGAIGWWVILFWGEPDICEAIIALLFAAAKAL